MSEFRTGTLWTKELMNSPKFISAYTSMFQSLLHASIPPKFLDYLHSFLTHSLSSIDTSIPSSTPGHTFTELLQSVPMPHHKIPPPSQHLGRLSIFLRYSSTFMNVALAEIEKVAKEEAERGWEVRCLSRARQRVGDGVVNWLAGMMEGQGHGEFHAWMKLISRSRSCAGRDAEYVLQI